MPYGNSLSFLHQDRISILCGIYLAMTWKEKGDIKKALEEFHKIDPKSEEFLDALKQITFIHIKSGSLDEGIETIQKHFPDSKNKKELYISFVVALRRKNRLC